MTKRYSGMVGELVREPRRPDRCDPFHFACPEPKERPGGVIECPLCGEQRKKPEGGK
jgi:hypothetical protein